MSNSYIINIIFVALSIILGFVSAYFKSNSKLFTMVTEYISKAETEYKDAISGGQKFQIVVGELYKHIPVIIRPFIPEKLLPVLVQNIFDQIDTYAKQQLDKATNPVTETNTAVK